MKLVLTSFLAVGLFLSLNASDGDKKAKAKKHVFQGQVFDKTNAEALTGASITIVELDKTVYADFTGTFSFEDIPEGNYTIEVSFVSYDTKVLEDFQIRKDLNKKRILL